MKPPFHPQRHDLSSPPLVAAGDLGRGRVVDFVAGYPDHPLVGAVAGLAGVVEPLLSVALGLVLIPLPLFWSGWLVGLFRMETYGLLILLILLLAWFNGCFPHPATINQISPTPGEEPGLPWYLGLLALLLALAIVLAYAEPQTAAGSYPIRMGDWVKHHGVAWSLRHTGIPPKNVFFSGMAPDNSLVYYYFLHLSIASLDILRLGPANIHFSFVVVTVIASLSFALTLFCWRTSSSATNEPRVVPFSLLPLSAG